MSISDVVKKETIENINQIENKKSEETESDSISQILKNNTHKFTKNF